MNRSLSGSVDVRYVQMRLFTGNTRIHVAHCNIGKIPLSPRMPSNVSPTGSCISHSLPCVTPGRRPPSARVTCRYTVETGTADSFITAHSPCDSRLPPFPH